MAHRIIKTMDGPRATALLYAGLMFLPTSITYTLTIGTNPLPELDWMGVIDLWHFGVLFILCGLYTTFVALFSRKLKPKVVGYGYVTAMIPPFVGAAVTLVTSILTLNLEWLSGIWQNLCLLGLLYVASAWPNPIRIPEPPSTGSLKRVEPPAPEVEEQ